MTYSEKLKDPKWQKKRLEILERDEWTCQSCFNDENTLYIHHLKYNKNPWNTKSEHLITLCEQCHIDWHENEERLHNAIVHISKSIDHITELTLLLEKLENINADPMDLKLLREKINYE